MSRSEALHRLQILDSEIDKAMKRGREIEAAIKENPTVKHAREELDAAQKVLTRAIGEHKSIELDVRGLDEKIKSEEERLYGGKIKASKEMLDVQHEVDALKKRRTTLDDQLINAELAMEEARSTDKRVQLALADAQQLWEADRVTLRKEMDELRSRYGALAEQRKVMIPAIPQVDQTLYGTLRSKKPNGVAVAALKNGVCAACGEEPSSAIAQQAKLGTALVTCGSCGRILHGA